MMMMLNSCTKEKMPEPVSTDADKDLQLARGVRPDFTNSKLICQLGNFYGDWLNYQNANASIPFHEMRFDTVEVVMPSSWNFGKECYEVDPITQQEMYQELSTAVGTAESRVNTTGLTNPHVVAVAVEILKPKITNPNDFDGYVAPFNKGEIDTIYVGDQQPYKFRVITAVGGVKPNLVVRCGFQTANYTYETADEALTSYANSNPCWPVRACRYFIDVKSKDFGFSHNQTVCLTKDYLFEFYDNPSTSYTCMSFSPALGFVNANTFQSSQWMNYFLNQGRNLAMAQGFTGYDILGYQWTNETCPCSFTHIWHNLKVIYGKCKNGVPDFDTGVGTR